MGEILDRLITALWQTMVFCGPMWFVFVAIMITLIIATVYFSFCDEARHATSQDRATETSNSRGADRQPIPGKSVVFDQEQLPAWMPTIPIRNARKSRA
jgi:hypothetical protein